MLILKRAAAIVFLAVGHSLRARASLPVSLPAHASAARRSGTRTRTRPDRGSAPTCTRTGTRGAASPTARIPTTRWCAAYRQRGYSVAGVSDYQWIAARHGVADVAVVRARLQHQQGTPAGDRRRAGRVARFPVLDLAESEAVHHQPRRARRRRSSPSTIREPPTAKATCAA